MEQEINWEEEVDKLEDRKEFLKLEQGVHQVKFMDNGVKINRQFETNGVIETKPMCQFAVMYKSNSYLFNTHISTSKTSLYAQLAVIGKHYGSLQNRVLSIQVLGSGKKKRYTISEALVLMQEKEEVIQ